MSQMWTDRQTDTQTEKDVNPTSRYSTGFSKIVFSFKYLSNEAAAQARQLLDNRDLDGFCLQVQLGNASGDSRSINFAIRLLLLLP